MEEGWAPDSVQSIIGKREDIKDVISGLVELSNHGVVGRGAAFWLRSISMVETGVKKPDLVWSGQEVPGLYARNTRQVYQELLGTAESSIWASTYAFFDGPKAFEVLANRMDSKPTLGVTLLINIQRKKGDTSVPDQLVRRFADRFWKSDWPGISKPSVYYDPRALEPEGQGGVLHAKAVVTDDANVFITSANLTEAALDKNIELGVLLRDREFALTITSYFKILIDGNYLKPLPTA